MQEFNKKLAHLNLEEGKDVRIRNLIDNSATIVALKGSNKVHGSTDVTFIITKDLRTLKRNLGVFDQKPNEDKILTRFNEKNGLKLVLGEDINIISITETGTNLIAISNSTKVHGTTKVQFIINSKLSKFKEDLGSFENQPDAQMILEQFNKLNDLKLELDKDVIVEEIQQDYALIVTLNSSKVVVGTIKVGFWISSIKEQPTKYLDNEGNEQTTNEKN